MFVNIVFIIRIAAYLKVWFDEILIYFCIESSWNMPTLIGVSEFVEETRDDYNSPITSTFVSRMQQCRNTITTLEEVRIAFLGRM